MSKQRLQAEQESDRETIRYLAIAFILSFFLGMSTGITITIAAKQNIERSSSDE